MGIQNTPWINLKNCLLLSESIIMISNGLPDKIVGKSKIAHGK